MSLDGKKKGSRWGGWFRRDNKTAEELVDEIIEEQDVLEKFPHDEKDISPPREEVDVLTGKGAQQVAADLLRADLTEWARIREEYRDSPKDAPKFKDLRNRDAALAVAIWKKLSSPKAAEKKYGPHLAELMTRYHEIYILIPFEAEFQY